MPDLRNNTQIDWWPNALSTKAYLGYLWTISILENHSGVWQMTNSRCNILGLIFRHTFLHAHSCVVETTTNRTNKIFTRNDRKQIRKFGMYHITPKFISRTIPQMTWFHLGTRPSGLSVHCQRLAWQDACQNYTLVFRQDIYNRQAWLIQTKIIAWTDVYWNNDCNDIDNWNLQERGMIYWLGFRKPLGWATGVAVITVTNCCISYKVQQYERIYVH